MVSQNIYIIPNEGGSTYEKFVLCDYTRCHVSGVVRNVVPFGCFVDCGVGDNGLIHRSNLAGNQTPKLGDRVAVTVIASPKPRKLQLRLERILD